LNHNYKLCRPDPNSEYGFTDLIGSRFNTDRDAPPCSILIFIQENKSVHRGMMLKFVCASGNPYNDVKFCLRNRKQRVFLIC
jgi:hypothetical protein